MRSKYETHVLPYLDWIKLWVAKGATCQEIAEKLRISRESLNQYKNKYADVYNALMAPRGEADDQIEAALFRRCIGYNYEESSKKQTTGKNGELIWLETRTTKHLPPDPSCIQFWLTNRRPDEWQRNPEQKEKDCSDNGVIMLDTLFLFHCSPRFQNYIVVLFLCYN